MLIAVASKDGKEINLHFGHAERFHLYEVEGGEVTFHDEIEVTKYCSGNPDHGAQEPLIRGIAHALNGCRAIVCEQIGSMPLVELERLGFDVYSVTGPIRPALIELAKIL